MSKINKYKADWEILDKRPLPEWYDDIKFGLFIHWGPYSAENCGAHELMKPELLTAENYDPYEWVDIAQKAGMKYITFTTKHGGGYAMWDSQYTQWSAVKSGPQRDLFGELVSACRNKDMRIIAYYCKNDMFNRHESYQMKIEEQNLFNKIVKNYDMKTVIDNWPEYMRNSIKEIFEKYAPDGYWFDGTTCPYQFTKMHEVVSWLYNQDENIVVNDRVGNFTQRKKHGDYFTYERQWLKPVHILPHKWESEPVLGNGWTYNPDNSIETMQPASDIIWDLVDVVSKGGNYLLNIGPKADGSIPDYYITRLKEVGKWMDVNGEAIYNTRPWKWGYFKEGENIRYTLNKNENYLYVITKNSSKKSLNLEYLHPSICVVEKVELLGSSIDVKWDRGKRQSLKIKLPEDGLEDIPAFKIKFKRTSKKRK